MTLLERVTMLMQEENIKPAQLVEELGISNSSFTDWKKGKGKPSLDVAVKFSEYFNVSLDYLVKGKEPANNLLEFSSDSERELVTIFRKLPSELKINLLSYAKGMETVISHTSTDEKRLSI